MLLRKILAAVDEKKGSGLWRRTRVKGTKKAEDHLRDCEIKVLSYWRVEMHNRSEIEFHGLHKASVYW